MLYRQKKQPGIGVNRLRTFWLYALLFIYLPATAQDILIVHLSTNQEGDSHEIYIFPVYHTESHEPGVPKPLWEKSELDFLNIPSVIFDKDSSLYIVSGLPAPQQKVTEHPLLSPDNNNSDGYSVTAWPIGDASTLEFDTIFSGAHDSNETGITLRGFSYLTPTIEYMLNHALPPTVFFKVIRLMERSLEVVTQQTYPERVDANLSDYANGSMEAGYLMSGHYPAPNGTKVTINIDQNGLIYIEAPQQVFRSDLHSPPEPIIGNESPPVISTLPPPAGFSPFPAPAVVTLSPQPKSLPDSDSARASSSNRQEVYCKCRKSKCLKHYCSCFSQGNICNKNCKCNNCKNHSNHVAQRLPVIKTLGVKLFDDKLETLPGGTVAHSECYARRANRTDRRHPQSNTCCNTNQALLAFANGDAPTTSTLTRTKISHQLHQQEPGGSSQVSRTDSNNNRALTLALLLLERTNRQKH